MSDIEKVLEILNKRLMDKENEEILSKDDEYELDKQFLDGEISMLEDIIEDVEGIIGIKEMINSIKNKE